MRYVQVGQIIHDGDMANIQNAVDPEQPGRYLLVLLVGEFRDGAPPQELDDQWDDQAIYVAVDDD